ncbi:hypothetical protein LX99_04268 [Mucilaginibacter oryzae]|uniref:Uncharacterized protein n=1 Tax=Mucilaginibacter oryzae TaxID=468058 RepID=A0A316H885_9SPHI|nr:hypothetical protein [Mucilaginibacter oryzae]PWK72938.1 hypothetical protein LX99_04268 [Mucilaginibacter oryzae]
MADEAKNYKRSFRDADLTIDEIRSCKGFEHFTDEQALQVIANFKEFSLIVFNYYRRNLRKRLE